MEIRDVKGRVIFPDRPTEVVDERGWLHRVPPRGASETVRAAIEAGVDLRGADFAGWHLRGIRFARGNERVDLRGARFDFADLDTCDFSRCDLRGASFRNANCFASNFSYAHVDNCDFSGAILTGAWFSLASFDGARFDGADLAGIRTTDEFRAYIAAQQEGGNGKH